ncbi:Cyclin-dependent kinase [Purpureocillium takamizusanense]|uniref:cyclin-dependent kinase n=1 Tax=Purpureocillium takamizusanense TaxID=2060973 RepID=A0A9Q8Q5R0_9HYPO|nr:Cyclin-dependent kinase [Purpureocillium takamizusanense]UNI13545.1 Cyclin-dependent kinase [Purpureocillium takamizusanense]
MASKGASRWADTEEDAELDNRLKLEKEEKRRKKAAKARQLDEQKCAAAAAAATTTPRIPDDSSDRPSKRRRLTPEPGASANGGGGDDGDNDGTPATTTKAPLLRFEAGGWGRSRSVDNYEKLNDIEEGTYGWVARATDRATGKVVALKRLKTEPQDRNGVPVTGLREMQILRDCSHRNVVGLEEVVVGDDLSKLDSSIFLVLEFVEHDLKGILEDMPEPFLASEIKSLLQQLASGVAYLHDSWILHRDLKTSNLLLNNRGRLKIADFGMARYVGDPPPVRLTQLVVTLWYRAPELLLGARDYGPAVDMWSVGCVFGELLRREPLLQGANEVSQALKIFELCGPPSDDRWPGYRKLPNARSLRLPPPSSSSPHAQSSRPGFLRARFPTLTAAGVALLEALLSLDPARRPSARDVLRHEYFSQDPKPKPEGLFPTFPSKAGQERRRRPEPHAPARGQAAAALGDVDLRGIFQGRDDEERGAGFSLRLV